MFYLGPMVSFRSACKVSSYIVRAKVYPLERTVGSFKCNESRCQVRLNVNESDTFTSTVTKKTYKTITNFTAVANVYLLTCKKCLIQYVCKTLDEFCFWWKITKIILETVTVNSHACRGIYMNITQALVIVDF